MGSLNELGAQGCGGKNTHVSRNPPSSVSGPSLNAQGQGFLASFLLLSRFLLPPREPCHLRQHAACNRGLSRMQGVCSGPLSEAGLPPPSQSGVPIFLNLMNSSHQRDLSSAVCSCIVNIKNVLTVWLRNQIMHINMLA